MNNHPHPLRFGVSIDPEAAAFPASLALARQADAAGLDYLALQDHPYQAGHLDNWTALTHLAAVTERIAVVPDVLDLQLRLPSMVAKAAASLAVQTGGRVQLGVGGGATAQGVAALGGVPHSGGDAVAYTEEAVAVIRTALRGGTIRLRTDRHRIEGYRAGPVPPEPVGVWVGAQRPRMLRMIGSGADGWISPLNIYVPPEEVPTKQAVIDEAAIAAGRDPREVRRIYNVIGSIGGSGGPGLGGPAGAWAETLADWSLRLGFDTFVFWPTHDAPRQLALFSQDVVPAVRELVTAERSHA